MLRRFTASYVILLICISACCSWSQTIKGTVSDEKTGEKLPFVSVFLNNTSVFAETDPEGKYLLKNIAGGSYNLIVRMSGYKPFTYKITVDKGTNAVVDVRLSPDEKVLEEIKITTKRDKTWENQLQVFEKQFLGAGHSEAECKIVNPWVLDFTSEKGVLEAKAQDVIEINNQTLGYQIRYSLTTFRFDGSQVFFSGYAEFSPLFSNDSRQKARWEAKRREAYRGSDIHFFQSLAKQSAASEGFEFFVDKPGEDPSIRSPYFFQIQAKKLSKITLDSAVKNNGKTAFQVALPARVEVHFNHKEGVFSIYKDKPCQVAWIETNGQPLRFNEQGILLNPQACSVSGYLAENRVANMLPLDYQSAPLPAESKITPREKENTVCEIPFFVTDRPYYYTEDLIRVSGTVYYPDVTSADTLSTVLHLELLNPDTRQIIVRQRLKIKEGRFSSQIILNDSLIGSKSKVCLLRSYTQWMRNFSDSAYSYRWVPIIAKNERADYTTMAPTDTLIESIPLEVSILQDSLRLKTVPANLLWGSLTLMPDEAGNAASAPHFVTVFRRPVNVPKERFRVEKGVVLSGQVADYKPAKHANVMLVLPKENLSFFASINEKGQFLFTDLPINDNMPALIQVINPAGKPIPKALIQYDSIVPPSWIPRPVPSWKTLPVDGNTVSAFLKEGIDLQEVKVKATAPPKPMATIYKEADYVVQGKDMYENAVGMNILSALQGRVPGLRIVEFPAEDGLTKLVITMRMGASAGGLVKKTLPQPLVLVDGVPFDNINQIAMIPVTQVERVEVVNRAEAITGLRGYVGVISIITKQSAKTGNLMAAEDPGFKKIYLPGITETAKELASPIGYYQNSSFSVDSLQNVGIQLPKPLKNGRYRLALEGLTKEGKVILGKETVEIK
ncbi:MAG: carboxypeptidase-like regulatory domain-containing protein [Spirosomataceae bacterium]